MNSLYRAAIKLGVTLTPSQLQSFEIYFRELVAWNEKVNLTGITDYEEVQIKHFLDSLTVATAFSPEDLAHPVRCIDIGTGAGLPGIPLKIVFPQLQFVLLEATTKKTKFLEYLVDKLELKDVDIVTGRAEEVARDDAYRGNFNVVVSRAVAALPVLAELCLPFCAVGGTFIAQKKGDVGEEISRSVKAIDVLGGRLCDVKKVELEEFADNRVLVIIKKISATPPSYPRRPGIPAKRPISP
jgi:16S rRNA (guanine527-N7)-methyltransferase